MEAAVPILTQRALVVPEGLPSWITSRVIDDTLNTWQPYYTEPLTVDDAVGILLAVGNLLHVLKGDGSEKDES